MPGIWISTTLSASTYRQPRRRTSSMTTTMMPMTAASTARVRKPGSDPGVQPRVSPPGKHHITGGKWQRNSHLLIPFDTFWRLPCHMSWSCYQLISSQGRIDNMFSTCNAPPLATATSVALGTATTCHPRHMGLNPVTSKHMQELPSGISA